MTRTRIQHGLLAVLALLLTLSCSDETSPSFVQRALGGEGGAGGGGGEGGGSGMDAGFAPPTEVVIASEDTFVSEWPDNQHNHATETLLSLQGSPQVMRPLLKFDLEDIRDAVAGREILSAQIELSVQENNDAWCFGEPSCADQTLEAHRMSHTWEVPGATWECANDSDVSNNDIDCGWFSIAHWFQGWPAGWPFIEVPTGTTGVGMNTDGVVALEVTSDVRAMLAGTVENHGWLVKLAPWPEGKPGRLDFASLEHANTAARPRLALYLGDELDGGTTAGCTLYHFDANCDGLDDDCDGEIDEAFVPSESACGGSVCASTGMTSCVNGVVLDGCQPTAPCEPNPDATLDVGDTWIATWSDNAHWNHNFGSASRVHINRGVVFVDTEALETAADGRTVRLATLELVPTDIHWLWGDLGVTLGAFRSQVPSGEMVATGSCPVDTNLENDDADCIWDDRWDYHDFWETTASGTQAREPHHWGRVRLDLTDDVNGILDETVENHGWVIYETTGKFGFMDVWSREGSTEFAPRIQLWFDDEDCTATGIDDDCDGVDDDCDGTADDGYAPTATECGEGYCTGTGSTVCEAGSVDDTCVPPTGCSEPVGAACEDDADCALLGVGATCLTDASTGLLGGYCTTACSNEVGSEVACPTGSVCRSDECVAACNDDECVLSRHECVDIGYEDEVCIPICTAHSECGEGRRCSNYRCTAPGCSENDTTCDGFDDDCDEDLDEDYAPHTTSCGLGACASTGVTSCVAGSVHDSCSPPAGCETQQVGGPCTQDSDCASLGSEATCLSEATYGILGGYCTLACATDDEDAGVPPEDTCPAGSACGGGLCFASCFEGECALAGHSCIDVGNSEPLCLPICTSHAQCGPQRMCQEPGVCVQFTCQSTDSTCNAFDDDCNGQIDEDVAPIPTACGPLACDVVGEQICVSGEMTEVCPPAPNCESDCDDAVDNDGNSLVDCDDPDCALQRVCDAPLPGELCSNDGDCTYLGAGAVCLTERNSGWPGGYCSYYCDSLDLSACPEGSSCAGGRCLLDCTSEYACDDPRMACNNNYGPVATCTPSCTDGAECLSNTCSIPLCVCDYNDTSCDEQDDDCDGTLDDDYQGSQATCGVGACVAVAYGTCVDGEEVPASCTPGSPTGTDQDCDHVDNDCDGTVDEGFVSTATTCGVGACVRSGVTACTTSGLVNQCTPGNPSSDNDCDGIDDDCDGVADDNYVGAVPSCGVGACANTGIRTCVNASVVTSCTPRAPLATNDVTCNNVDDDCDGTRDENYVSRLALSCGVGACYREMWTACGLISGVGYGEDVPAVCFPGQPSVTDASCNGVDNDCNGSTDEDYVPPSYTCGAGQCANTVLIRCENGSQINPCVAGTPGGTEICDGQTNDCDGIVDEGISSSATTCGTGVCASTGTQSCVSGHVSDSCVAACENTCGDGIDEDHDGDVDCADSDCEGVAPCPSEICGNSLDDDGDQLADCADPTCGSHPACAETPDPALVAPALSRHEQVNLYNRVHFLIEGSDPVQRGVVPGAISEQAAAWVRGRVLDPEGDALSGVRVFVPEHPELGSTNTRSDGQYDLLVNGGALTLAYEREGYAEMVRSVAPQWGQTLIVSDVALTPLSEDATMIDLQVNDEGTEVVGELVEDGFGSRRSTLFFPPGVEANMTVPGIGVVPLPSVTVRATELSRGEHVMRSTPGGGPNPTSVYTVDLRIDEAHEAGATRVDFSTPVPLIVDNYHQLPVGTLLPSRSFNEETRCWGDNVVGRVIKIIGVDYSILGHPALLDTNGDDEPEDAAELLSLGIDMHERIWLRRWREIGYTFWRIPVAHFSLWEIVDEVVGFDDCILRDDPEFCRGQLILTEERLEAAVARMMVAIPSYFVPIRLGDHWYRQQLIPYGTAWDHPLAVRARHWARHWRETVDYYPGMPFEHPHKAGLLLWWRAHQALCAAGYDPLGDMCPGDFSEYMEMDLFLPPWFSQDITWTPIGNAPRIAATVTLGDVDGCEKEGFSSVECLSRSLSESITLVGTGLALGYSSRDHVANRLHLPLTEAELPEGLVGVHSKVSFAGRTIEESPVPAPNLAMDLEWDGTDAFGRKVVGTTEVAIEICYEFASVYGDLVPTLITDDRGRMRFCSSGKTYLHVPSEGFGGWTIDGQHKQDAVADVVRFGDGSVSKDPQGVAIETVYGHYLSNPFEVHEEYSPSGLNGLDYGAPAKDQKLRIEYIARNNSITVADDGSLLYYSGVAGKILSIRNGLLENAWPWTSQPPQGFPVEGCGNYVYLLNRAQVTDGSGNWLRRYEYKDGVLQPNDVKVLADGATDALQSEAMNAADLYMHPMSALRGGEDCSLWFVYTHYADGTDARLGRIDSDGVVTSIAPFDTGIGQITGFDTAPNGEVWVAGAEDWQDGRQDVVVVDAHGRAELVASHADVCHCPTTDCYVPALGHAPAQYYSCELTSLAVDPLTGDAYVGVTALDVDEARSPSHARYTWVERVGRNGYHEPYVGTTNYKQWLALRESDATYGSWTPREMQWPNHTGDHRLEMFDSPHVGPDGFVYFVDNTLPAGTTIRRFRASGRNVAASITIGGTTHDFDANGRHTTSRDPVSGAVLAQLEYASNGALEAISDAYGNTASIERGTNESATAIVAPDGQRTELDIDSFGRLVQVTAPDGSEHHMTYDGDSSLLTSYTAPNGAVSTFTYDDRGKLIRDQGQTGGYVALEETPLPNGTEVVRSDANGVAVTIRRETSRSGDVTLSTTGADGTTTSRVRSVDGDTTVQADGTQLIRTLADDPNTGEAFATTVQQILPSGLTRTVQTSRSLETYGEYAIKIGTNQVRTVNGERAIHIAQRDQYRTVTHTSAEGRVSTVSYDIHGRVTDVQAPGIAPMHVTYDSRGRLATTTFGTGADARVTTQTYDAETGYLAGVTGPLDGASTTFDTDVMGRVIEQTLPNGENIEFGYDVSGNLTSLAPPARPDHAFGYNSIGQPTGYTAPAATVSSQPDTAETIYRLDRQPFATTLADGRSITRDYQADGKVDSVTTPHGVYDYEYDETSGRLISITTPEGHVVQKTFDGPLLTGEQWTGTGGVQGAVSFAYNTFFEVTSVSVNGSSSAAYTYDDDGLIMSAGALTMTRDATSGQLTGTAAGTTATAQTYNAFGEIATFSASAGSTALYSYEVTERDKLGRIVQREETVEGLTKHYQYAYDLSGRLTDVWTDSVLTAHYTFDANGNRLSKVTPGGTELGTYDAQDRVQTYGGFSYLFDDAGFLLAKTETATSDVTEYEYDVFGNLRTVALPDGRVVEYEIDAKNRRVGKKVDGVVEYRLLYLNRVEPIAVLDDGSNVVATFVYGTKTHVPELMIAGGVTYRFVEDHLGSVRMMVNTTTGAVVQRLDYDESGVVTSDTNPGFQPFGFAGGIYDPDAGFVRFGARDYEPVTGRWTAKDPIGFRGGTTNLYQYCYGDALNLVDSSGHSPWKPVPGQPMWEYRSDPPHFNGDDYHYHFRHKKKGEYARKVYEDGTQEPHGENNPAKIDEDVPQDVVDDTISPYCETGINEPAPGTGTYSPLDMERWIIENLLGADVGFPFLPMPFLIPLPLPSPAPLPVPVPVF